MTKNVFKYIRRLFFEKISGVNMGMTTVITNNKFDRKTWIEKALSKIPAVSSILNAGAGEQQYKRFCFHDYCEEFPGVLKAVNEYIIFSKDFSDIALVGSLLIAKKCKSNL